MIDWAATVRKLHALGLWHATRYLAHVATVKDPTNEAADVVQEAWLTLWRRGLSDTDRVKGLFVTTVLNLAANAARASRPVDARKHRGEKSNGLAHRQAKTTSLFPIQIFGVRIAEITMFEDVHPPSCGDE